MAHDYVRTALLASRDPSQLTSPALPHAQLSTASMYPSAGNAAMMTVSRETRHVEEHAAHRSSWHALPTAGPNTITPAQEQLNLDLEHYQKQNPPRKAVLRLGTLVSMPRIAFHGMPSQR